MVNTEFSTDISVGMLMKLNKSKGLTVDINDGQITGVNFCSKSTEN